MNDGWLKLRSRTHSFTRCICRGCKKGLECGVPSREWVYAGVAGVAGLKSPGLDAGVLPEVFSAVRSIVEQLGRRRHIWLAGSEAKLLTDREVDSALSDHDVSIVL